MKKSIYFLGLLIVFLGGCRGCQASFQEREQGVKKVCPQCNFVFSQGNWYAVDTSKQPNIVYIVQFKPGGIWYKASDVNALIRIN